MRDKETRTQRERHRDCGDRRTADERFADRIEDNEAGVTKHRDRDHPTHELHRDDRIVLTDEADHHIREFQRGARLFEYRPDHRSEDDDDADARERPGEPLPDDGRKTMLHHAALEFMIDERNARSETQPERNQHDRDERVYAQLRNHDDHDDNRHDKGNDERQTGHVNTPYI